jgi:beta-glucosidase
MIALGKMRPNPSVETDLTFPRDFRWGTATSAHQVEGNNIHNDWWVWEQQPGRIKTGDRSGLACDWWNSAERDFDAAADLHQNAHRLSIEWSRIQPEPNRWDESAVDRYRQMLAGLRRRGIEPMVTLHHFTNPRWFAERGGWGRDDAAAIFARFVERLLPSLKEFTNLWCTVNEPVGWAFSTYVSGVWPPGERSVRRGMRALTQLLRGHAAAYRIIHRVQPDAQVGFANYFRLFDPARTISPLDRLVATGQDRFVNRSFVDGAATGRVRAVPWVVNVPEAARTLDFLGVNYYTRDMVTFDLRRPKQFFGRNFPAPGAPVSDRGYGEVYPEGLYRVLRLAARYGKPIFITENGLPDDDDDRRSAFIVDHLTQVWRAMDEGIPVRGYYHWSLVDNFEWTWGWSLKFGLIQVDPITQTRTRRSSASLYAAICRDSAIRPKMLERFTRSP